MIWGQRYRLAGSLIILALALALYNLEWTTAYDMPRSERNARLLVSWNRTFAPIKIYEYAGKQVEVPADFTQAEIAKTLGIPAPPSGFEIDPVKGSKTERLEETGLYIREDRIAGVIAGIFVPLLLVAMAGFIALGKRKPTRMSVMRVPLGIFSMQLWSDAQAYLRAADILVRDGSRDIDAPTYFTLSHALELALKAYLVAEGQVSDRELRVLNHDIQRIYERAAALGLNLTNQSAVSLIRMFSDFHKAMVFRYPIITRDDGSLVLRGTLVRASEALSIIGETVRQVHAPVLRARFDAVSGREYPIETWHMG